jgi:hypothetical protein
MENTDQNHNAEIVARLEALAGELGLTEVDLDEHVYDVFDHLASSSWNGGEGGEDPGEVHDEYSHEASAINNSSLSAQIACILEANGEAETERLLRESV